MVTCYACGNTLKDVIEDLGNCWGKDFQVTFLNVPLLACSNDSCDNKVMDFNVASFIQKVTKIHADNAHDISVIDYNDIKKHNTNEYRNQYLSSINKP